MKIAVIGGAGFIGRQLIRNIHGRHDVTCIDLIKNDQCNSVICDITKQKDIEIALNGFETVYLLAAVSEASKNTTDPVNSMNLNIMGTVNVLNACVANKVKKIIFASTVWVYDACKETHVNEDSVLDPNYKGNLYTTSKICGEMLIKSFSKTFGIDYTILRLGTAYGPGCNPRTAIASFVKNAVEGTTIKVQGNGEGFRSFMHVSDHANILENQLNYYGQKFSGILNVDGPEQVSLNQMIDLLRLRFPDLKVEYSNLDSNGYTGKIVSCEKRNQSNMVHPRVSFKDGLNDYVDWYQENFNNSSSRG